MTLPKNWQSPSQMTIELPYRPCFRPAAGRGFVHAQHSDPCEKFPLPVALRLVEELTQRGDVTLAKILKKLPSIGMS